MTVPVQSSSDPHAEIPDARAALLARAGVERGQIYELVRGLLDDFEAAAPWDELYAPALPDDALLAMHETLLGVVSSVPERMHGLFDSLKASAGEGRLQEIEDAEFFLTGVHDLVAAEWRRLRQKLPEARQKAAALSPDSRAFLCELAADLKGKYTSSLMGASTAVVAEGLASPVESEPVLFAEKAEEFERNQRLYDALSELRGQIGRLGREVPFRHLLDQWRSGRPVEPYALAELTLLRARIACLLTHRNRRALYSGDFHQIRRREEALSSRLDRLRLLQQATWSPEHPSGLDTGAMAHELRRLLLELVAVVDVDLLAQLVGEKAIKDLRALAVSCADSPPEARSAAAERLGLPSELHSLVPLFAEEDLGTFFDVLLGAVARRASLRATSTLEDDDLSRLPDDEAAGETLAPIDEPEVGAPIPSPREPRAALAELMRTLRRLRAPDNPQWRNWQMLKRILSRDYGVPTAMLLQSAPYLEDVLASVVPDLEAAAPLEVYDGALAIRLHEGCSTLLAALRGGAELTRVKELQTRVDHDLEELGSALQEYVLLQMS